MRRIYFSGEKQPTAISFTYSEAREVNTANFFHGSSKKDLEAVIAQRVTTALMPALRATREGRESSRTLVVFADPDLGNRDIQYIEDNLLALAERTDPVNPHHQKAAAMLAAAETNLIDIERSSLGADEEEVRHLVLARAIEGGLNPQPLAMDLPARVG